MCPSTACATVVFSTSLIVFGRPVSGKTPRKNKYKKACPPSCRLCFYWYRWRVHKKHRKTRWVFLARIGRRDARKTRECYKQMSSQRFPSASPTLVFEDLSIFVVLFFILLCFVVCMCVCALPLPFGGRRVRGYLLEKRETKVIEVTEPGDWIVGVEGDVTQVCLGSCMQKRS